MVLTPFMAQTWTMKPQAASRLHCYTKSEIPLIWDWARPLICLALDRGSNQTIDQVYEKLCNGHAQMWAWSDKACLVTEIHDDGDERFCLLLAIGGSAMNDWKYCYPVVAEWAKGCGAKEMQIYGRVGWARAFDFDIEYAKMVRPL